eukprot:scaffold25650_cov53-Phaeocystis_antarctica.AAC.3
MTGSCCEPGCERRSRDVRVTQEGRLPHEPKLSLSYAVLSLLNSYACRGCVTITVFHVSAIDYMY